MKRGLPFAPRFSLPGKAQAAKQGHDILYKAIEALPMPALLLDPQGKVLFSNQTANGLFEADLAADPGRRPYSDLFERFYPATDLPFPAEKLPSYHILKLGEDHYQGQEYEVRLADGRRFRVEPTASAIRDAEGNLLLVLAVFRDTTQSHHDAVARERATLLAAATALFSSSLNMEGTLRLLADMVVPQFADWCTVSLLENGSPITLAIKHADPARTALAWKLREKYGRNKGGSPSEQSVIAASRSVIQPVVTDAVLQAHAANAEHLEILRTLGISSTMIVPIPGKQGVAGLLAFVAGESGRHYNADDVLTAETLASLAGKAIENSRATEQTRGEAEARKAAQDEALRLSEERTRSIIENLLGGVITLDDQAAIAYLNPAAERLFGYPAAELIGQPMERVLPSWEVDRVRAFGRPLEEEGRRKDGRTFSLEITVFEYTYSGRRFLAANVFDISQRREAERMKKTFVSRVSHELRTPLTSIHGSLGLLKSGALGRLEDGVAEMVAIAERNSGRIIGLVNDILDMEKMASGKTDLDLATCEIQYVVQQAIEAVAGFAQQRDVRVQAQPMASQAYADEKRIVQVLVNLLSNAVKFSPRGSAVHVYGHQTSKWIEICVTDQGRGIASEEQMLIFEPFYQTEESRRESSGSGLGLAIARTIVEQHGGAIGVDSKPGKGSTFWFRLARSPMAAVAGR